MFSPISADERVRRSLVVFDLNGPAYKRALDDLTMELRSRIQADQRIHLHDVQRRVKDRKSLETKLRRDPSRDIEDAIGVRIITYFRDDAIWVEQIVREMLLIREGSYSNKADKLNDREFGYRSIQFVATVPSAGYGTTWKDDIRNLITPPELSPAIVEIQIRSILEHAWAEAEHDVYANRDTQIPRSVRRRFALTAALIENADEQLETLRDELSLDRPDVEDSAGEVQEGFVQRFVENDRASIDLDHEIAAALDIPKRRPQKYSRETQQAVLVAGIRSYSALQGALLKHSRLALRMAIVCTDIRHSLILPDSMHEHDDEPVAFPGIGIYWLSLGLLHQQQDPIFGFNSVSPARLKEYRDVGQYLAEHPNESALAVRDRYQAQRHPSGGTHLGEHDLVLGPVS